MFSVSGNMLKNVTIDRSNNCPSITIGCEHGLNQLLAYSMQENNINPFLESLPLMNPDRYSNYTFGLILDCSRSHTEIDSEPITDSRVEVNFEFKV